MSLYTLPQENHPRPILERLAKLPEHAHFQEDVTVEFLMREAPIFKAGKFTLGAVHIPTVQGKLKDLFDQLLGEFFGEIPDFLIILDAGFWEEATDQQREALMYHEMCHVKQEVDQFGELRFDIEGNPKYALVAHDLEVFNAEVQRYGAWHPGIETFLTAAGK